MKTKATIKTRGRGKRSTTTVTRRNPNHYSGPVAKNANKSSKKAPIVSKTKVKRSPKKTVIKKKTYAPTTTYGKGKVTSRTRRVIKKKK